MAFRRSAAAFASPVVSDRQVRELDSSGMRPTVTAAHAGCHPVFWASPNSLVRTHRGCGPRRGLAGSDGWPPKPGGRTNERKDPIAMLFTPVAPPTPATPTRDPRADVIECRFRHEPPIR
ncbi:hypothetical protein GCM10009839_78280 [Catenulispora yoronensis]|uniref:Uncharacterized protein n=1 Tax=Catenulispora yoronensis TaxID=450799 RepID=A0ABP5GVE9_9ACTN